MYQFTYRKIFKAVSFLMCCFFLYACENDMEDVKALSETKTSVEEGIHIESYLSQEAKVKARLTAPLMRRYQTDSPYVEFPKTLHVDFYNDTLFIESQLNARYGRYRENEHKVFLKDSVVFFNLAGDTLYCRELWWDQHTQNFYTDKPVRMVRKDNTVIHGLYGLTATQNLENIVFLRSSGQVPFVRDDLQ
jgi:LPS export ABC transporter protein LptC